MIPRLVSWCSRHHWIVIALAVVVGVATDQVRRRLTGDVIPDLADPQIGLVADWMGHPAPEVATAVTAVLTDTLADVPGATAVRGWTMTGMAYVDLVFDSASVLETAHQAIVDRMIEVSQRLPADVRVQVGPVASSSGWVLEYALTDPAHVSSMFELRQFQDDVLRPALSSIPGVAEVASVGGETRQVRIDVKPRELRNKGLAFTDVLSALRTTLASRSPHASQADIEASSIAAGTGRDVQVRDVALVRLTKDMPTGMADLAGAPAVGGIVIARRDADVRALVEEVKQRLAQECRRLPHRPADPERLDSGAAADVHVAVTYDRSELVTRAHDTLLRQLCEEIAVVAIIVLVFLLHMRSALVPLITLPLILLLTLAGMWLLHVPVSIMSLGGIGIVLGIAVDADIVALEACHRQLETVDDTASAENRRAALVAATQTLAPAILTALFITALSFLPVFAFTGETGRLLRPLVITKTLVIASAGLVAVTLAPALRDRLLVGRVRAELANPITRFAVRTYRPFVHFALSHPGFTLTTALLALASCVPIVSRLGGEFLPRIDEGDLLYMPTTFPGVLPEQAATQLSWQDQAIRKFGEIENVFGKVGRADTGTDPAPYSMVETTIRLRPRAEWPKVRHARWYSNWAPWPLRAIVQIFWPDETPRTMAELVDEIDKAVRLPGWSGAWTAPARARMDMLTTGIRTPVGIRVFSSDASHLNDVGAAIRAAVADLPGTRSAVFEALGGETWTTFDADPAALVRHHVDPAAAQSVVEVLTTGGQIGEIAQDGRRLRVRIAPELPDVHPRGLSDQIREVTVRSGATLVAPDGQPVPLGLLGHPAYVSRPAAVRSERGELCAYVYVDLNDGVDMQSYVDQAKAAVESAIAAGRISLARGERPEWAGEYVLLLAGQQRLRWIVPIVALSMFGLLYLQFRSLAEALIVFASVPFALVGSIWTLYLLGYPLSAPVWVGLLSVVGLAMQTGVVMVVYIDEAFYKRVRQGRLRSRADIVDAHMEGTVQRLRPKLMTITTMAASLLPLLWAEGAGAEIMRRVAAPMFGGLITSAFLTLEVLPVLYTIWRYRQLRHST